MPLCGYSEARSVHCQYAEAPLRDAAGRKCLCLQAGGAGKHMCSSFASRRLTVGLKTCRGGVRCAGWGLTNGRSCADDAICRTWMCC
jgi:hypothetical protein